MRKSYQEKLYNYLMVYKWPFWISAITTGVVAVSYSNLVHWAEKHSQFLITHFPKYFFILSPLFFAASWALVYFLAPEAKGSGIPQVMAAVDMLEADKDNPKISQLLSLKIALVKVASSILALLGGGAIGREGPTLQISASIFYYASQRFSILRNYIKAETWIITGAAAGLAAAFNTPLGGLVYAIEELATVHLNKFKTSLITGIIIAGFSSQMISGPYLYLGYPAIPKIAITNFPFAVLIGIICGAAGALFGKIIYIVMEFRFKHFKSKKMLLSLAMVCGLVSVFIAYFLDMRFMGSGKDLLLDLLFTEKKMEWYIPILRFFAPIVTYISGCAGGIFAPSLVAGGTIGQLFANLTSSPDSNLYTLLGMIGFLTGATRAPFTAFILVLEMTDRHSAIFPMMMTALLSNNVARLVSVKSLYELFHDNYCPKRNNHEE